MPSENGKEAKHLLCHYTEDDAPGFLQKILGHILGKSLSLQFSNVASPVGTRRAEPSAPATQSHFSFRRSLHSCDSYLLTVTAAISCQAKKLYIPIIPSSPFHGVTASKASTCNLSALSTATQCYAATEDCLAHCSQGTGLGSSVASKPSAASTRPLSFGEDVRKHGSLHTGFFLTFLTRT